MCVEPPFWKILALWDVAGGVCRWVLLEKKEKKKERERKTRKEKEKKKRKIQRKKPWCPVPFSKAEEE